MALRVTLQDRINRTMQVLEGALQSAQTVAAISTILCAQQNQAAAAAAPAAAVAAAAAQQPQRPIQRPNNGGGNRRHGSRNGSRRQKKENYKYAPNPSSRRPFHRGQGVNYSMPPGAQFHKGPIRTRKY